MERASPKQAKITKRSEIKTWVLLEEKTVLIS